MARKYRPKSFADLVGQGQVTRTLTQALKTGRVAHAYLFTGPRGVGKTTAARLLAAALACESAGPRPCGECPRCREIQSGRSVDVLEMDAASNRGINEIRGIRDTVKFLPTRNRYKVYIIDEVHALTPDAFNALLKTLEEPPSHVVFVFATTEAHKLPATILSRCQRYDFRRIRVEDIAGRLKTVAEAEGLPYEPSALTALARQAEGGLRDALGLADQVAASEGELTADAVSRSLGLIRRELTARVASAAFKGDAGEALLALKDAYEAGCDFKELGLRVLERVRDLALFKASPKAAEMLDLTDAEEAEYRETVKPLSLSELHRHFESWLKVYAELARHPQPRWLLESHVIRTAQAGPLENLAELTAALAALLEENPGALAAAASREAQAGPATVGPAPALSAARIQVQSPGSPAYQASPAAATAFPATSGVSASQAAPAPAGPQAAPSFPASPAAAGPQAASSFPASPVAAGPQPAPSVPASPDASGSPAAPAAAGQDRAEPAPPAKAPGAHRLVTPDDDFPYDDDDGLPEDILDDPADFDGGIPEGPPDDGPPQGPQARKDLSVPARQAESSACGSPDRHGFGAVSGQTETAGSGGGIGASPDPAQGRSGPAPGPGGAAALFGLKTETAPAAQDEADPEALEEARRAAEIAAFPGRGLLGGKAPAAQASPASKPAADAPGVSSAGAFGAGGATGRVGTAPAPLKRAWHSREDALEKVERLKAAPEVAELLRRHPGTFIGYQHAVWQESDPGGGEDRDIDRDFIPEPEDADFADESDMAETGWGNDSDGFSAYDGDPDPPDEDDD
jgi:DNA polymerase-3 subunit gamma/tau